jgi:hypothetical protein
MGNDIQIHIGPFMCTTEKRDRPTTPRQSQARYSFGIGSISEPSCS